MTQFPRKRKPDAVDFTETDHGSARASKASRTESFFDSQNVSPGMRFGESADFIPLPLSQVALADEEDDEAAELVQGSQDDSSTGNFMLYGKSSSTDVPYGDFKNQVYLNNITRSIARKDCWRSLLQWRCYVWRTCLSQTGPP